MKILITGTAGFIGAAVATQSLQRGDEVVGIDNVNDYYQQQLKYDRLKVLEGFEGFTDIRLGLEDSQGLNEVFRQHQPQHPSLV